MSTTTGRVLIALVAIAVASVFFVVLKDNDDSGDSAAKVPTIVIKGGEPVSGIRELSYEEGDQIRFKVTSDVSDEVHVHGYDLAKDVKAGGTVSFDFPATIEGVFEAELEGRKEQIAELRVNP